MTEPRIAVTSSHILAIAHDLPELTLEVVFKPNRKTNMCAVWHYKDVDAVEFEEMLTGPSVGKALEVIKRRPGIVAYQVGEEPAPAEVAA